MDTKSYFKNLTKSVNYAVDDLLKAKYPATYNMKHLKSSISEGNKEYREAEMAAKRAANNSSFMKPQTIPFDKDTTLMNLKLDARSGKFYNKSRIKAYEDKAIDNAFNQNFGQSMDEMSSSFGVLAKAVGNQSRINVQIANSQMQNQRRNTIFQDSISRGRHIQSMQLSGMINNNIANIVDFNNNKIAPFLDQTLNYYRDQITESRKISAAVMQLNEYYRTVNHNTLNPKTMDIKQTTMEQAFLGGFNAKNYTKLVRGNFKDVMSILSGAKEAVENNQYNAMTSPISYALNSIVSITTMLNGMFGDPNSPFSTSMKTLGESFDMLEKTMQGLPAAFMLGIMNMDKSPAFGRIVNSIAGTGIGQMLGLDKATNLQGSLAGIIRSIFGISTDTEYNLSRYDQGAMQFNGITQKAITMVIPTLLGRIYTTLAGYDDDIVVDYNRGGKIKWASQKRKEIEEEYQFSARSSMKDFNKEMIARINSTNVSEKDKDGLNQGLDKLNDYLAKGGLLDYNNPNFRDKMAKVVGEDYANYFTSLIKTLKISTLNAMPFNQISAQMSRSRLSRQMEMDADRSGLSMAYAWEDEKYEKKEVEYDKKSALDKFSEENRKYNQNIYGADTKSNADKARSTSTRMFTTQLDLIKSIRDILIQGIIVYPMKRVPLEVMQRKQSLRNVVSNNEREEIRKETEQRALEAKLGESINKDGSGYDNLNDPEIGNITSSRIDPSLARRRPEEALADSPRQPGFKGFLQELVNAPMRAATYMISGFSKLMNRLIYGTEADGEGLLDRLVKRYDETIDKVKEWFSNKGAQLKEKWDNSEIGKKVQSKIDSIKDWFTKPNEENDNFAAGFQEVWTNAKNYAKDSIWSPIKNFGIRLGEEFSGTIDQFRDMRGFLFGKDDKNGLLHKDYAKYFDIKGMGFDFKKSGGKVLGTAALGAIGGLFLGGPLLGAAIAGGSAFVNSSEVLKRKLFGTDEEEGLIDRDFAKALPGMAQGVGIGLLGHLIVGNFLPGGPITASIIGAFGGYMNSKGLLNKLFWGGERKDGSKFKGIFTRIGDFFYDHIGGYIQNFFQKQITKFQYAFDRWILIPLKDSLKPFTTAISKSFSWMGNKLVSMIDKATGGTVSWVGKQFKKLGGMLFSAARWLIEKTFTAKFAKTRFLLTLPGRALAGANRILAKTFMDKEQYQAWSDKHRERVQEAKDRRDEKTEENKQWFKQFKEDKKNGISWSDKHPMRKKDKNAGATNGTLMIATESIGQMMYKTNDDTRKTFVQTAEDMVDDIETIIVDENGEMIEVIRQVTDKIIDELKPNNHPGSPDIIDGDYREVRDVTNRIAGDLRPGQNTVERKYANPVAPVQLVDKVTDTVRPGATRKTISLTSIEAQGLPINYNQDNLIGKDAIEQANEAKAEQQAEVLEKIEWNTQQSASWLGNLLKGNKKEGGGLFDWIKGIGGGIWGLLSSIGTIATIGFGIYEFLKYFNNSDGDTLKEKATDAALNLAGDVIPTSGGMKLLNKGVKAVDNTLRATGKVVKGAGKAVKGVTNLGGKVVTNVANVFKGGNTSTLTKSLASGEKTVTGVVAEAVTDSVSATKSKLITKLDDALKLLCKNKTIGKFIQPLYNGVKKAFPKIAEKVTKAAGKGMLRSLSKALVVAEAAFAINDAVTGFMDYRNILNIPKDSPQDNVMAAVCAIVRCLNGLVCFGLVPERWFIELVLSVIGKRDVLTQYQEEFKQNAEAAGFGDNLDAYNKYENPTTWNKILSGFGIVDSRKEVVEKQVDRIKEELKLLDPNSSEYKEKMRELELAQQTLSETTDTWYEVIGNFLQNVIIDPLAHLTSALPEMWKRFVDNDYNTEQQVEHNVELSELNEQNTGDDKYTGSWQALNTQLVKAVNAGNVEAEDYEKYRQWLLNPSSLTNEQARIILDDTKDGPKTSVIPDVTTNPSKEEPTNKPINAPKETTNTPTVTPKKETTPSSSPKYTGNINRLNTQLVQAVNAGKVSKENHKIYKKWLTSKNFTQAQADFILSDIDTDTHETIPANLGAGGILDISGKSYNTNKKLKNRTTKPKTTKYKPIAPINSQVTVGSSITTPSLKATSIPIISATKGITSYTSPITTNQSVDTSKVTPAPAKTTTNILSEKQPLRGELQLDHETGEAVKPTTTRAFPIKAGTYTVSSGYGNRVFKGVYQFHPGIDYAAPKGTPIYAADSGKAYLVKEGTTGFGNYIRIRHNDGYETVYGHASKLDIKQGQNVVKGQKIAEVGSTGNSTGNHLHFGAYKSPLDKSVPKYEDGLDPVEWLGSAASTSATNATILNSVTTNGYEATRDRAATDVMINESDTASSTAEEITNAMDLLNKLGEIFLGFFTSTVLGKDWKYDPNSTSSEDGSNGTSPNTDTPSSNSNKDISNVPLVDFKYLTDEEGNSKKETFLEKIQSGAIRGYYEGKVIPSLTLSQAALESGWGASSIGNNIFGIKAGKNWDGKTQTVKTTEYFNGSPFATYATFRDYNSVEDSILDHTKLLTDNSRYAKVLKAKNYKEATAAVQAAGYATDPNYANSLNTIIEHNKLNSVDKNVGIGGMDSKPLSLPNPPKDAGGGDGTRAMPIKSYKRISSPYGWRDWNGDGKPDEFHDGLDYAAPAGTPIYAADSGVAYVAKYGYNGGWGNHIRIKHGDGYETIYGHASKLNISQGARVTKGQKIAEVGTTGRSTGNHLHFGVYKSVASGTPKYGTGIDTNAWLGTRAVGAAATNTNATNQTNSSSGAKLKAKVICGALNIRQYDSFDSKIMGVVRKGEEYNIVRESNGLGQLEDGRGWISMGSKYVEKTQIPAPAPATKADTSATEVIEDPYKDLTMKEVVDKLSLEFGNFFNASGANKTYKLEKETKTTSTDGSSSTNTAATPSTPTNGDFLGIASVKYETGVDRGDPAMVSNGAAWGDPGGTSYGIPQFATNTGSAKTFVNKLMNNYPVYKKYFAGKQPGTQSFGEGWKRAAAERGDEFRALQLDTIYDGFYTPWRDKMKSLYGVDIDKDRALQEAGYSISVNVLRLLTETLNRKSI